MVASNWTNNSDELKEFLKKNMRVDGGMGNEAMEIALNHVNSQINAGVKVTQVLVIGDMSYNTRDEVIKKKKDHWNFSWGPAPQDKYADDEIDLLAASSVPIQTFAVSGGQFSEHYSKTISVFADIARRTNGSAQRLSVTDHDAKNKLFGILGSAVIEDVADGDATLRDELMKAYGQSFGK